MWKKLIYQGVEFNNFEISDDGKLRNVITETEYKIGVNGSGYSSVCVSLGSRNKLKAFRIHKAVAETFIPNPKGLPCINHKDGNKQNNRAENLEWCSYSENMEHAYKSNLIDMNKKSGENARNSVLKEEDVLFIRNNFKLRDKDFGIRALARRFGVHKKTIECVIYNKSWNYVYA